MSRAELVGFLETWSASFNPPVVGNTHVTPLAAAPDRGFVLTVGDRQVRARKVVVASGGYQIAHRSAGAESLPASLHQVLAEDYRNSDALPPGNVLLVGSGYRPHYGWLKLPVFDDMGFSVQVDGRAALPGLYFVGVHWMRKNKSAIPYGVGEDAEVVARDITENRA